MMKMESKRVKIVMAGRHHLSIPDQDKHRRVYTPSVVIPRPMVRRASVDGSTLMKMRGMTLQRANSMTLIETTDRKHDMFTNPTPREIGLRKPTTPSATPLSPFSPSTEIKSILKGRNGTYGLKVAPDITKTQSENLKLGSSSSDKKFNYRLPVGQAPASLRKSVSFKDDQLHYGAHKAYTRHFSSPIFSLPGSVYKSGKSENVMHITNF